ncbi:DPP IV N-terminal domain-containing protein [Alkalinema sp. FACHB-956]|uniref:DPP IV N-terminal domain-containing protein n=1 Tax=Alkalinema sp. FACHB-956 TaxID=2692768 RepID=UPI00168715B1|nr:DPP IV N-terminal domain-containing protein [Alkalinema sp. FACHB-956]MBD2326862.1 PD40 domain-containing protein [Alkalinema sp. FACHB-956]
MGLASLARLLCYLFCGLMLGLTASGRSLRRDRLVFTAAQSQQNSQIVTMSLDRLEERWLTRALPAQGLTANMDPAWSPDGRWIAFIAEHDNQVNLYLMDANGANLTQLTHGGGLKLFPTWSPDSRSIAYMSNQAGSHDLYVVDITTRQSYYLTRTEGLEVAPSWSPDGRFITFVSDRDGNYEIYNLPIQGSLPLGVAQPIRLTNHPAVDTSPAWSPDGRWLAFTSDRDNANGVNSIYLLNQDTRQLLRLTDPGSDCAAPAWSADGRLLAITQRIRRPDGRWGIPQVVIMTPDGKEHDRLTHWQQIQETYPSWSLSRISKG